MTEVRAGVFTTFDLVMKNVGVCALDDIALSVVSTVIGHNREKGWVFIDAGWMALSRDRGTASQAKDYGYGLVCDLYGSPYNDLCVTTTNQNTALSRYLSTVDLRSIISPSARGCGYCLTTPARQPRCINTIRC